MKNRRGKYLYFCSAEQDSLYALTLFREKEKQGTLNVQETGLLLCMEQRAEDSWIYLMPAAVYAAANQKGARSWMNRQKQEKIDLWNEKGIAWMRRYPVFLEQFGWKQRRYAILAAGIFEQLEEESMDEFEKGKNQVCHFLQGSWGFLWKRMQQCAGMERNESAVEGFCADGLRDVRHSFIDGTASEKRTGRARPALRGIYEAAAVHTGEPANKWYRCEAICKGIGS